MSLNLKEPLLRTAFPKICPGCARVYRDGQAFIEQTVAIPHASSPVKEVDGDMVYLEVFRNCQCGTTLMELFASQRDVSDQGLRRRMLFSVLLESLTKLGMTREEARSLLLEFVAEFRR